MALLHIAPRTKGLSEVLATSAGLIVVFLAGMLACAFLLLYVDLVDPRNIIVQMGLGAVVSAFLMTAGCMMTRGQEALKDRRDVSRKMRGALVQIRSLADAWRAQRDLLATIEYSRVVALCAPTKDELAKVLAGATDLRQLAANSPTFVDTLDSDDDHIHAEWVRRSFAFTASHFDVKDLADKVGREVIAAEIYVTPEGLHAARTIVEHLEAAEDHFKGKIAA